MQRIINGFTQLPAYVQELLTGPYLIYVVLALFFFLVVLFFNGRVAHVLRQIFVLAAVVIAVIAYFKRKYPLIWLCAAVLLILALYRLLFWLIVTIRQARINHRIEKRALERARMRRGARKRDFEGTDAPSGEDAAQASFSEKETPEEVTDSTGAEAPSADAENSLTRAQVFDAIRKLTELKDDGILTEAELNRKKRELYARLK